MKNKQIKKISIIALHLGFGGVENSICSLANMLCDNYNVEIISTYKLLDKPAFELNGNINIKYLLTDLKPNREELKTALKNKNIINFIKEIRKSLKILFLKKYLMIKQIKKLDSDIVITTRDIHNRWVGKYAPKNIIKIATEHNHHNNNTKYVNKIIHSLKNIDYLIPVSQELTNFYKEKLKSTRTKVIYIPHALDSFPDVVSNLESKNIISVGRLVKEKGYLDLIDVFETVYKNNHQWKLNIVGDGTEKELIQKKIKENGLEKNIILHGVKSKDELAKIYLNSSIYVMTSYTESFGLVLIEAESYGIPLIAFDSAQGANEIIDNNINGYLISNRNKTEMSNKIIELIKDVNLRQQLGLNGRIISEQYKKQNIKNIWINFLKNI